MKNSGAGMDLWFSGVYTSPGVCRVVPAPR
jgi:hypothetical protein